MAKQGISRIENCKSLFWQIVFLKSFSENQIFNQI